MAQYVVTHSCGHTEYGVSHPLIYRAIGPAMRRQRLWTAIEDHMALDPTWTAAEVADALGRTRLAVKARRYLLYQRERAAGREPVTVTIARRARRYAQHQEDRYAART